MPKEKLNTEYFLLFNGITDVTDKIQNMLESDYNYQMGLQQIEIILKNLQKKAEEIYISDERNDTASDMREDIFHTQRIRYPATPLV